MGAIVAMAVPTRLGAVLWYAIRLDALPCKAIPSLQEHIPCLALRVKQYVLP